MKKNGGKKMKNEKNMEKLKFEEKKKEFLEISKKKFSYEQKYFEKCEKFTIVKSIEFIENRFNTKNVCWHSGIKLFLKRKVGFGGSDFSVFTLDVLFYGIKIKQESKWVFFNKKDLLDMINFKEKGGLKK